MFSMLNFRQMIVHFIAFLFFIYGSQFVALTYDYGFLHNNGAFINIMNNPGRFNDDMKFIDLIGVAGLLVAYVISWAISNKRGWYWANSIIVFVIALVLKNFNLLKWDVIRAFFSAPGEDFILNSSWFFIALGTFFIAIGLLLFFIKKITAFIEKGNPQAKTTAKGGKKKSVAVNVKS
jgi:hypothetical protein